MPGAVVARTRGPRVGPPPRSGRGSFFRLPGAAGPWLWTAAPFGAGFFFSVYQGPRAPGYGPPPRSGRGCFFRFTRGRGPLAMDRRPVRGGVLFFGLPGAAGPWLWTAAPFGAGFFFSVYQGQRAPGCGPPPRSGRGSFFRFTRGRGATGYGPPARSGRIRDRMRASSIRFYGVCKPPQRVCGWWIAPTLLAFDLNPACMHFAANCLGIMGCTHPTCGFDGVGRVSRDPGVGGGSRLRNELGYDVGVRGSRNELPVRETNSRFAKRTPA